MSCTVFPKSQSAFSNTNRTCSHIEVNGRSSGVQNSKKHLEPRLNIRPTKHHYLHFSHPQATDSLNKRHEHRKDTGVFPRNIYTKHPFSKSMSYHIQPRDKQSHYTYSHKKHPKSDEEDDIKRTEHVKYYDEYGSIHREGSYGHQEKGYITEKRGEHTPWHSVFGYDRFHNEYGVGSHSRGYIEPYDCHDCHHDVPQDMAPSRFYSERHLGEKTMTEFRDAIDEIIL